MWDLMWLQEPWVLQRPWAGGQADATVGLLVLIMFCMFSLYYWCFIINIYGKHWAGLALFLGCD